MWCGGSLVRKGPWGAPGPRPATASAVTGHAPRGPCSSRRPQGQPRTRVRLSLWSARPRGPGCRASGVWAALQRCSASRCELARSPHTGCCSPEQSRDPHHPHLTGRGPCSSSHPRTSRRAGFFSLAVPATPLKQNTHTQTVLLSTHSECGDLHPRTCQAFPPARPPAGLACLPGRLLITSHLGPPRHRGSRFPDPQDSLHHSWSWNAELTGCPPPSPVILQGPLWESRPGARQGGRPRCLPAPPTPRSKDRNSLTPHRRAALGGGCGLHVPYPQPAQNAPGLPSGCLGQPWPLHRPPYLLGLPAVGLQETALGGRIQHFQNEFVF